MLLRITTAPGGAASGHVSEILQFTNTGTRTCTVQGYPRVQVLTSDNRAVDAAQTASGFIWQGDGAGSAPVTLAPGQAAKAVLEWEDVYAPGGGIFTGSSCPANGVEALLATLPGSSAHTRLPSPGTSVCGHVQIHALTTG